MTASYSILFNPNFKILCLFYMNSHFFSIYANIVFYSRCILKFKYLLKFLSKEYHIYIYRIIYCILFKKSIYDYYKNHGKLFIKNSINYI